MPRAGRRRGHPPVSVTAARTLRSESRQVRCGYRGSAGPRVRHDADLTAKQWLLSVTLSSGAARATHAVHGGRGRGSCGSETKTASSAGAHHETVRETNLVGHRGLCDGRRHRARRITGRRADAREKMPPPPSASRSTCCGWSSARCSSSSCRRASRSSRPASAGRSTRPTWCRRTSPSSASASSASSSSATRLMFGGLLAAAHRHGQRRSGRTCSGPATGSSCGRAAGPVSGQGCYTAGGSAFFLYMVAFMDTVATIPTGAMAERWKWKAFVGWGLFCGAIYYPLFGAWTWGGGWLRQDSGTRMTSAPATSTSPAPASCTPSAASPRSPVRSSSDLASASTTRTASANTHPGSPHPDGDARHVHPAVRLVRLQRGIDLRGHRRPVRGRRRRTRRSPVRSAPSPRCSG